jgi:hypothetical protein
MHCDITLKVGQIQYFETKRNRKSNQIKTSQIYASNLINTISFLNCLIGSTVKSAFHLLYFHYHLIKTHYHDHNVIDTILIFTKVMSATRDQFKFKNNWP